MCGLFAKGFHESRRVLQKGQVFLLVKSAEWQTATAVADNASKGELNFSSPFWELVSACSRLQSLEHVVPQTLLC